MLRIRSRFLKWLRDFDFSAQVFPFVCLAEEHCAVSWIVYTFLPAEMFCSNYIWMDSWLTHTISLSRSSSGCLALSLGIIVEYHYPFVCDGRMRHSVQHNSSLSCPRPIFLKRKTNNLRLCHMFIFNLIWFDLSQSQAVSVGCQLAPTLKESFMWGTNILRPTKQTSHLEEPCRR